LHPEFINLIVLLLTSINMKAVIAVLLAVVAGVIAQTATTSEPALAQIQAAAATTKPEITTSNVKGLAFDRFYQVWLENIVHNPNHL
jgi:acid phosphatase